MSWQKLCADRKVKSSYAENPRTPSCDLVDTGLIRVTGSDSNHCWSSNPFENVAAVSLTALMAASLEAKPAWIRIDADQFMVPVSTAETASPNSKSSS